MAPKTRWFLPSSIVFTLALSGLVVLDRFVVEVMELLLVPWLHLCRLLTPLSWQTRGNILLGLFWMISGLLVYSMITGGVLTLLYSKMEFNHVASDSDELPS